MPNRNLSLQYNFLLSRQAWVSAECGVVVPNALVAQADMAVALGDLFHTLKPDWVSLRHPVAADPEDVLDAAAELLRCALAWQLSWSHADAAEASEITPLSFVDGESLVEILGVFKMAHGGWAVARNLCSVIERYGLTPSDLVARFWERGDEQVVAVQPHPTPSIESQVCALLSDELAQ